MAYERALLEKSKIIKRTEAENLHYGRRKQRGIYENNNTSFFQLTKRFYRPSNLQANPLYSASAIGRVGPIES